MPKGGGIFVTAGYRRGPAFPGGDFWSVQNRWIQTEVRKISASRNIFLKRFLHVFTRFHILLQISSRFWGALRSPETDRFPGNPGRDKGVMNTIF